MTGEYLSVLAPVTITDAMVSSSTALENDYGVWAAGTTYGVGQRVISTVTHRIYESQQATGNTGKDPTNLANQSGNPVYWVDVGPTNKWAMFDGEVSTQTVLASPLTVVLRPGSINAIFLAGLDAENISITVKDAPGGNVVFAYSGPLESSAPPDYQEYFFDRFKPQTDYLAYGIDQFNNSEVTVTLTSTTGQVKCGFMAVGDLRPLGLTQRGVKAKPKTYSYINTDKFGNTKIVRRKATTDMSATAYLDVSEANTVLSTIQELLDVPCVWIGSSLPEHSGMRVFGLGSGELSYDDPNPCLLTLTVQGLI